MCWVKLWLAYLWAASEGTLNRQRACTWTHLLNKESQLPHQESVSVNHTWTDNVGLNVEVIVWVEDVHDTYKCANDIFLPGQQERVFTFWGLGDKITLLSLQDHRYLGVEAHRAMELTVLQIKASLRTLFESNSFVLGFSLIVMHKQAYTPFSVTPDQVCWHGVLRGSQDA